MKEYKPLLEARLRENARGDEKTNAGKDGSDTPTGEKISDIEHRETSGNNV